MLIKKKFFNSNYLLFIKSLFSKFLFVLGFIFLTLIISVFIYYFSSGLSKSYSPKIFIIKVNEKILDRYLGINILRLGDYIDLTKIKIKYFFTKPQIEQLNLKVSQKTILQIEQQRQLKKENFGILPPKYFNMYNMQIQYQRKKFKAKMRIKGVRPIHWQNKRTSSYKIDLIGNNRLWGMEEFSVQKPITKNYAYEFLFHKLLKRTNNLYLKYFPINLYFNDENRRVYAVEESFSKELLERQKKRNGPIFSLNEDIGEHYPNVNYELYSSKYWIDQYPELSKSAFSILNQVKDNEDIIIENYFDIDRWASYFAVIDMMGAYHGSLSKSIRLYFNPTTSKFEPIGYDAHLGAGNFSNFILTDLLQENRSNCIYICDEKSWYFKFFKLKNGELNSKFLEKYIYYLNLYSTESFINEFLKEIQNELDEFNLAIYSENSKADKITWKGLGPYLYDDQILYRRAKLIKKRINSINFDNYKISLKNNKLIFKDNYSNFPVKIIAKKCNDKINKKFYLAGNMIIDWKNGCKEIFIGTNESKPYVLSEDITMSKKTILNITKDFENLINHSSVDMISQNEFEISKNLDLTKNTYTAKNQNFLIKNNVQLQLKNGAILFIQGNIKFEGSSDNKILIKSDGSGSIIFENNDVTIKHTNIENLGYPILDQYILHGGLNFIKANVVLENILVKNSKGEDAINLISSSSLLKNISLENIQSDAIDIDFGSLKFNKIICLDIRNDCLDISGAKTKGTQLTIDKSYDKGLSIGENSSVNIKDLVMKNSRLGVAVKDGSIAYLENFESVNNDYDIALFNKKKEYEIPNLEIKNFSKKVKKILQSKNSKLTIDNQIISGQQSNAYINSVLY